MMPHSDHSAISLELAQSLLGAGLRDGEEDSYD